MEEKYTAYMISSYWLEGSIVRRGYIFGSLKSKKMGNIKITDHVLSAIIVKFVNPL